MADLICRWRNGTAKTVVELANMLPHEKMPVDQFREKMKFCYGGDFFRTPYQLACQLALYCEAEDGFYYPRFDHDINEVEADEYLTFWIVRYFVPNPYVRKDGFQNIKCPTYFLKSLCDYVEKHPNCEYKDAYYDSFGETAKNNDDIIRNYINNYSKVLNFSKDGILTLTGKNLEERFAFMDRLDKKAFFDSFDTTSTKQNPTKSNPSPSKSFTPSQIIYYGVPGCGKSRKIADLLEAEKQNGEITDEEQQVSRVVFHPEYTNADFVGQVMPVVKPAGGVDYNFVAGPFTRILARAYANPTKPYFLVIEEINRGNAAAIFGEIFQLLDRHKKGESDSVGGNTYTAGWSKYFVDHVDVNGKIREEIAGTEYGSDEENPKITFTANTAIRLPPNLSIYATMNTSDQNVFALDNAFKRRFDSELVRNTLDGAEHEVQRETKIEGTNVTWGTFWERINDEILNKNSTMSSSEDKRLGAYFIVGEEKPDTAGNKYREISRKLFGEKVLEYLWDDAFKYKRNDVFKEECKSVESLIENFEKGGFAAVFKSIDFTAATTRELEAPEK